MIRLFFLTTLVTCVMALPAYAQHPDLDNAHWTAFLQRSDRHNIPFNFEVRDSAGRKILYLRNAGERLLVDNIQFIGDSVIIRLPFFESELRGVQESRTRTLKGTWYKRLADRYQEMPFLAWHESDLFPTRKPPIANISGRWAAWFGDSTKEKPELLIGEFKQQGNDLTGTFLEQTGDYRYLEGFVDGDSLRLSCFDGGHAYLFTALIEGNGRISGGEYYAGPTFSQPWTAVRNDSASLPDEFSLTKWKRDQSHVRFSFRDLNGKTVSFSDPRFKDKIVLIQLMGSWCPNCMDETRFLSKFYDEYHKKGVEVIALAYERSTDFARSQVSVRTFQQRFQVKYPMLITGVAVGDPERSQKTLPQLDAIVGFPTTIFVNRHGDIEKIHTGFNGPGTGEHYEEQKKEFYKVVDEMLGE